MSKIILLIAITLLTGCSSIISAAGKVAEINDEALKSAEFTICNGASVGSVERRYNTSELLKARKVICDREVLIVE